MIQNRCKMLPKLKKCCWCLSLRTGCFLLAILSSLLCIAAIVVGALNLPRGSDLKTGDEASEGVPQAPSLAPAISEGAECGAGADGASTRSRECPEDSFIAMSMVMFATLCLISNVIILLGIILRRPGFLQLTILFNSVFIVCLFLVVLVTCLFSPRARPLLQEPLHIVLVVITICAGIFYSVYYMMVINSTYRQMKTWSESAIPV